MFKSAEDYYVQVGITAGGVCKSRDDPSIFSRIEDPNIFEFITNQLRERHAISPKNITTTSTTIHTLKKSQKSLCKVPISETMWVFEHSHGLVEITYGQGFPRKE